MKKLFILMVAISLLFSFTKCFAAKVPKGNKEIDKGQVEILKILCKCDDAMARKNYEILKAVEMAPIIANGFLRLQPSQGGNVSEFEITTKDYWGSIGVLNGAINMVKVGRYVLYDASSDAKVLRKASDIALPRSQTEQFKQLAQKAIIDELYIEDARLQIPNSKSTYSINPNAWVVINKMLYPPEEIRGRNDVVEIIGTYNVDLILTFRKTLHTEIKNHFYSVIADNNLNVIKITQLGGGTSRIIE